MRQAIGALLFLVGLAWTTTHAADTTLRTGNEVLRAAREVMSPVHDKSMKVTMRVVAPGGDERVRVLHGYEKHTAGKRKVLWIFDSPMELHGTGFLAWQNESEADSLWVYFPGQRRVRRVPPSIRRESFQGSLFTYEDLIAIFFLDYAGDHELTGVEPCDEGDCYVVDSALAGGAFAYDRLEAWIDTESLLLHRVEFFAGRLLKVMKVTGTKTIGEIPSIVRVEMENPTDGYRTRVALDEIEYNQDLDDNLFTLEHLAQEGK